MVQPSQASAFDGERYEKFMGKWSRAAGTLFLDWLSLPTGLKWLDVGCGTGAFTETISQKCFPAEIVAVDPAAMQVAYAQSHISAATVRFEIMDARSLAFSDDHFDVAVSALVINFIPDREKAIVEMRRVVRPSGTVAGYVWDFAGGRGNSQHLSSALIQLGSTHGSAFNPESTTLEGLKVLFESVGLREVVTQPIDIQITYTNFDDYWNANTGSGAPVATALRSLDEDKQQRVKELVKASLPRDNGGVVSYAARVNAVSGCV